MPLNRAPRPDELPPECDPDRLLRDLVAVAALIYYSNGDVTPLLRQIHLWGNCVTYKGAHEWRFPIYGPVRGVGFIEAGVAEGVFQPVDAPQLLLAIYSTAMGYLADARFISLLREHDAMSEASLAARRKALIDMVHATLGVRDPATDD